MILSLYVKAWSCFFGDSITLHQPVLSDSVTLGHIFLGDSITLDHAFLVDSGILIPNFIIYSIMRSHALVG